MASTTAETPHTVQPLDFTLGVVPFKTRADAGAHFDRAARFVMRRAGREELTPAERRDRARERRAYVRCCVGLAHNPKSLALLRRQAHAAARICRGERVTMPAPVARGVIVPVTRRRERPAPRRRRVSTRSSAESGDSGDSEPAPAWRRRIAARLSLRLADAAGHEALLVVMRADAVRRGWSA